MLENIIYYNILGKPLIFWSGLTTLLFLILTVTTHIFKRKIKFYLKYHTILAKITLILAIFHGTLGILAYI